ncbi:MAG: AtpZ/AtpI family protein [Thermodesulfobacteriota bacterium]
MTDFKWLKEAAYYGSTGISFALSVFIGLFFGLWLDNVFSTAPVLTFVFLGAGIAAGFRSIAKLIKKVKDL